MNDSIVCFLDILGYSKLVNKYHSDDKFIKDYEYIFDKSLLMIEELKKDLYSKDPSYNESKHKVINDIRLLTFSDSIIFILYITKNDIKHINNCLFLFLNLISTFCTLFISYSGNTLRVVCLLVNIMTIMMNI